MFEVALVAMATMGPCQEPPRAQDPIVKSLKDEGAMLARRRIFWRPRTLQNPKPKPQPQKASPKLQKVKPQQRRVPSYKEEGLLRPSDIA